MKHGKLANGETVFLHGECEACGCKFRTYVDVFRNVFNDGDLVIRTDPDCLHIRSEPEFVPIDATPSWRGYVIETPRVIKSINYSVDCPECRVNVNLKVING